VLICVRPCRDGVVAGARERARKLDGRTRQRRERAEANDGQLNQRAARNTHTASRNPVSAKPTQGMLLAVMATGAGLLFGSSGALSRLLRSARRSARTPCAFHPSSLGSAHR
jgi:hypothetical protein